MNKLIIDLLKNMRLDYVESNVSIFQCIALWYGGMISGILNMVWEHGYTPSG